MIVMYEIKLLPLHPSIVTAIVLWCNGSTSDSGSACEGSNPSKTTKIYHSRYLTGYFLFRYMNMQPKVSVMMITYNQEQFIDEAIRGVVLQQTSFPFELIIGDDCSTDFTTEKCRQWQAKYPDVITLLPREENLGVQRNYIDVYNHCRGEYIAVCEGDDYWCDKSKLQRQVEYMDAHCECTVCFHRVVNYFVDTNTMSLSNGGQRQDTTVDDLAKSNYITNLSVMYRRGVFGELPRWVEQVTAPDYTFHMLHASKGVIHYINRPMAVYRQSSKGVWSKVGEERRLVMSMIARESLINYFALEPSIVNGLVDAYVSIALSLIVCHRQSGADDKVDVIVQKLRQYREDLTDEVLEQMINERQQMIAESSRFTIKTLLKKCRAVVSYFIPRPRM